MTPTRTDNPSDSTRRSSPFCVLTAVFLTLVFLQAVYLRGDFLKRGQIRTAREQLTAPLNKAQTVTQLTEAIGRELIAMVKDSSEASNIVAEFKIQLNAPAVPSK